MHIFVPSARCLLTCSYWPLRTGRCGGRRPTHSGVLCAVDELDGSAWSLLLPPSRRRYGDGKSCSEEGSGSKSTEWWPSASGL